MEILPGIHRIPGLKWSNAYLLAEGSHLTLIDAGMPGDGSNVLRHISHIGRHSHGLNRIIVSHGHPDHTGPIKNLSSITGAVVMAHQADTRNSGTCPRQNPQANWLHYPDQPPSFGWNLPFFRRIPVHEFIEEGQLLPVMGGLRVIHTPGHTPGSVCLYLEKQQVLFTGDMLIADGNYFRRPIPFPGTNFRDYRASVENLAQLPFETACVGHGTPLHRDGALRLHEMLESYSWMAPRLQSLKRRSRSLFVRKGRC